MRRGHVPERTCRGCGQKGPKSDLRRFAVVEGTLVEVQLGDLTGRGIYCCNNTTCRERLAKSKKIRKSGLSMPGGLQRKGAFDE